MRSAILAAAIMAILPFASAAQYTYRDVQTYQQDVSADAPNGAAVSVCHAMSRMLLAVLTHLPHREHTLAHSPSINAKMRAAMTLVGIDHGRNVTSADLPSQAAPCSSSCPMAHASP